MKHKVIPIQTIIMVQNTEIFDKNPSGLKTPTKARSFHSGFKPSPLGTPKSSKIFPEFLDASGQIKRRFSMTTPVTNAEIQFQRFYALIIKDRPQNLIRDKKAFAQLDLSRNRLGQLQLGATFADFLIYIFKEFISPDHSVLTKENDELISHVQNTPLPTNQTEYETTIKKLDGYHHSNESPEIEYSKEIASWSQLGIGAALLIASLFKLMVIHAKYQNIVNATDPLVKLLNYQIPVYNRTAPIDKKLKPQKENTLYFSRLVHASSLTLTLIFSALGAFSTLFLDRSILHQAPLLVGLAVAFICNGMDSIIDHQKSFSRSILDDLETLYDFESESEIGFANRPVGLTPTQCEEVTVLIRRLHNACR